MNDTQYFITISLVLNQSKIYTYCLTLFEQSKIFYYFGNDFITYRLSLKQTRVKSI